jgi:tetratricopeptide (TPR) repeat protein
MLVLIPTMTAAPPRHRLHRASLSAVLVVLALSACKPAADPPAALTTSPPDTPSPLAMVAAARWETAREKHATGAPGEALALLASALASDPSSAEARELAREILAETRWHLPELSIDHGFPVDRLELSSNGQLWVGLSAGFTTAVRWDLNELSIGSVLFPTAAPEMRILVADPGHRYLVIQREGVTLLCDADTLKPIREIGPLPATLTPTSVIAFSADGLLIAHPSTENPDELVTWQIRDSATGEVVRSWQENGEDLRAIAAQLDRARLRLLSADGSRIDIPLSPVEEVTLTTPESPLKLVHAQFVAAGGAAWLAEDRGAHEEPALRLLSFGTTLSEAEAEAEILRHHPWSRHPGVWNGLLRDAADPPLRVDGHSLTLAGIRHSPIRTPAPLTAAIVADRVVTGDSAGTVTFHRILPLPSAAAPDPEETHPPDASHAHELSKLVRALTGLERDEESAAFKELDFTARAAALEDCDLEKIAALFPTLDFSPLADDFRAARPRHAPPDTLNPLRERLIRAGFIEEPAASPRAFTRTLQDVLDSGEDAAIESAIRSAGGSGREAATALALALDSERPEWIRAAIESARDMPPLLGRIARSRQAWLEGRKHDALAGWHEDFPDLAAVRQREDWDGWEQADFAPALAAVADAVQGELARLTLPRNPDEAQRQALVQHLTSRETLAIVGRERLARACLDAAIAFSSIGSHHEDTLRLASLGRQLGAAVPPSLRAEAVALTALGEFRRAQSAWVTLITEHPAETHQPGDYAEAAFTSFENDDLRQAREILSVGMQRFPRDASFAIRAGWVSLLIGDPDRAYEFLLLGERIGFPEERLETAITLLTVAAAECGYSEDAILYFEQLLELDPAWEDPATLETLDWPEPLKATLRQLTWGPLLPE